VTITAINPVTGDLTAGANWSTTINGLTAGDYLFNDGDMTATSQVLGLAGLSSYCPSSDPSDTLFGLDRAPDPVRRGGIRVVGTSLNVVEAIRKGLKEHAKYGGKPSHIFLDWAQYLALCNILGQNAVPYDYKNASVGFRGIKFNWGGGEVEVYPDMFCKPNVAFIVQMDVLKLHSAGPAPMILKADGLEIQRRATTDDYEVRVGAYLQLGCRAPVRICRVSLAAQ
jgi:hypothetical protein